MAVGGGGDDADEGSLYQSTLSSVTVDRTIQSFYDQHRRRKRQQQQHNDDYNDDDNHKDWTSWYGNNNDHYGDEQQQQEELLLYGREKEVGLLRGIFDRVRRGIGSETVLVRGVSGTGKTRLVESALRRYVSSSHQKDKDCLFVCGKFDQLRLHSGFFFSALVVALSDLCDLLLSIKTSQPLELDNLRTALRRGLTLNETQALASTLIPNLCYLLPELHHHHHQQQQHHHQHHQYNLNSSSSLYPNNNNNNEKGVLLQDGDKAINNNNNNNNNSSNSGGGGGTQGFTRLVQLCCTFLGIVAQQTGAVVLFLDDIQWADRASLQIIKSLSEQVDTKHLMLVLAIRESDNNNHNNNGDAPPVEPQPPHNNKEEEEEEEEPPSFPSSRERDKSVLTRSSSRVRTVDEIMDTVCRSQRQAEKLPSTVISLGNLDVESIHQKLCALLQLSPDNNHNNNSKTWALSEVIFQKTLGNAFSVQQYIEMLLRTGMVSKTRGDSTTTTNNNNNNHNNNKGSGGGWTWDLQRIQSETDVSENVVQLVAGKIGLLPTPVQQVLQLASFLGHRFHTRVLEELVDAGGGGGCDDSVVSIPKPPPPPSPDKQKTSQYTNDEEEEEEDGVVVVVGPKSDVSKAGTDATMEASLITNLIHNGGTSAASDSTSMGQSIGRRATLLVARALEAARIDGLVEKSGPSTFKFSHDRVQQCLCGMVQEGTARSKLHLQIGRVLYRYWKGASKDDASTINLDLLATDHLNLGSCLVYDPNELIHLVRLNLVTAKGAMQKCAFGVAANYLSRALELLNENSTATAKWTHHYRLSLDVVSSQAYVALCNGDCQDCFDLCQDVFRHAKSPQDKFCVHSSFVLSVASQEGRVGEGVRHALSILGDLGEQFPPKPRLWHVVLEIIRVKRALKGRTDADLLSLTEMKDDCKLAAMNLMSTMVIAVYADADSKEIFAIYSLRMMYVTCKHGYSEWAPFAFALYAALEAMLGNVSVARRFLMLTRSLIQQSNSLEARTRGLMVYHTWVSQLSLPFSAAVEGFMDSYQTGMKCGDIDFALYSCHQYVYAACFTNMNLNDVEADSRIFSRQMLDFKKDGAYDVHSCLWQMMLNLMGQSEDPGKLTGEAMDHVELLAKYEAHNNIFAIDILTHYKFLTAVYFDRFFVMEDQIQEVIKCLQVTLRGHFCGYASTFMIGLAAYKLFKRVKRRKYRRIAMSCTRKLQSLSRDGVVDVAPISLLLKAESMVLRGSKHNQAEVMRTYNAAITAAQKLGVLQWEAMFTERAFQILIVEYKDEQAATAYADEASKLYERWGADAKVEGLNLARLRLLGG